MKKGNSPGKRELVVDRAVNHQADEELSEAKVEEMDKSIRSAQMDRSATTCPASGGGGGENGRRPGGLGEPWHSSHDPLAVALELDSALEAEGSAEGSAEELERVLGRAERCAECRSTLEQIAHWLAELGHVEPVVAGEAVGRWELYHELMATEPRSRVERRRRVRDEARFQQWGLCRLLLDEAMSAAHSAPGSAAELGELAAEIGERLDVEHYGAGWVSSLRSRVAAVRAWLRMVAGDRAGARELLATARAEAARGPGELAGRELLERVAERWASSGEAGRIGGRGEGGGSGLEAWMRRLREAAVSGAGGGGERLGSAPRAAGDSRGR